MTTGKGPGHGGDARSERKRFESPDDRVFGTAPNENGPKAPTIDAAGEAAQLLRDAEYVVRVVVERLDGGAFIESEREFITAVMEAEGRGESATEAAATVQCRRAREGDRATNAPRGQERRPTALSMRRGRDVRSTLAVLRAVLLE